MKLNFLNLKSYIPVLITALILSSCSKDKPATPEENLTGTWTSSNTTYTAMVGTRTLIQYLTEVAGYTTEQAQLLIAVYGGTLQQSFTGTFQAKSDKTYTSNLGGDTDSGTWSLSADGKKLNIVSNTDGPQTYDVIELTSSKLLLEIKEILLEDLNEDDVPESINVTLNVSFTR